MKHDIRVVGVTLRDRQQKNGNRELAFFDVEVKGFTIRSCLIIAFRKGYVDFSGPRLAINPDLHAIDIRDNALRAEIVAAAVRAYHALGGTYEVASPAPAVETNDAEMKLLHDIGMVDAVIKPSRRGRSSLRK